MKTWMVSLRNCDEDQEDRADGAALLRGPPLFVGLFVGAPPRWRDRIHPAPILSWLFILCMIFGAAGAPAVTPVTVGLQEPWSNVFAGKDTVFHAAVTATEPFEGRVTWQLAAAGRALARGEHAVRATPAAPGTVELRLALPSVNPGVVMQTTLAAGVRGPLCGYRRTWETLPA